MGEWLVSVSGTPFGAHLATILALTAAIAHAVFGALQKGKHNPWVARGSIDLWFTILSAPFALFVFPLPEGDMWLILVGVVIIHFIYKLLMALAYEYAAYTVVYPVVRGTGPLITVIFASIVFHEPYSFMQWVGVGCLSGGILLLALRNLAEETIAKQRVKIALIWAALCGVMVAVYTTYDAWGIRQAADPFTFLAWFFFLSGIDMPLIAYVKTRRSGLKVDLAPLMWRGALGAVIGWVSFGGVMIATRLDKVGEAAVLRETSTVFAALIGWFILGEKVGPRRLFLMALIALGAVIVEVGG
ncbi:multidrug transporter [Marivivens niveibacter]|uniref:Multidrug transporter n=1 Tax=Marivivens niveibacter TaxID=1930667 RepID=A0A251X1C0_9RHOB|nr:DMT family transporter [Marivivens niveibacter]OUD10396.1 multidrug transporter [Marivivens niveibacter]